MRRFWAILWAAILVAGCSAAATPPAASERSSPGPGGSPSDTPRATTSPSSGVVASPSGAPALPTPVVAGVGPTFPSVVHGSPLEAGAKPDAATCERMIRDDRGAARKIRAAVTLNGPDRLASDPATVDAVANDPAAAISPALGIPLTRAEAALVRAEGSSDWTPLAVWVNDGAPERFGGYWIDRTGGRAWRTVAIPPADTATIALARCFERDVPIHYVQAAITLSALEAIQARIYADRDWLAEQGMGLMSLGRREDLGRITVGVEKPTPAVERFYRLRYGWPVLVEQGQPGELF
jgi:hypothetical protein